MKMMMMMMKRKRRRVKKWKRIQTRPTGLNGKTKKLKCELTKNNISLLTSDFN
jgi:hypothetical protein